MGDAEAGNVGVDVEGIEEHTMGMGVGGGGLSVAGGAAAAFGGRRRRGIGGVGLERIEGLGDGEMEDRRKRRGKW